MKKITNTESFTYEGSEYILNIDSKYAYRTEDGRKVRIPYSSYLSWKKCAEEAEKAAQKAADREADRAYLESIRPMIEKRHSFYAYLESIPYETLDNAKRMMQKAGYAEDFAEYDLTFFSLSTDDTFTFNTIEDVISFANSILNPTDDDETEDTTEATTENHSITESFTTDGTLYFYDGLEHIAYRVENRKPIAISLRDYSVAQLRAKCAEDGIDLSKFTTASEKPTAETTTEEPTTETTDAQIATATTEAQPTAEPTTASEEEAVVEEKKEEPKQKGKGKAYFRFWYTYHTGFRRETEKAIALSYDEGNGHEGLRWIPKSIILWGPVNSCGNQFFYVPKWFFFRNHYEIGRFECDGEVMASELTDHDIGGESYVDYNGQEIVVFENDGNIKPSGRVIDTIDGYEICRKTYNLDVFARKI